MEVYEYLVVPWKCLINTIMKSPETDSLKASLCDVPEA